jgi:CRP/FNR family cyclic AMP-dependent transcriptional regulator
LGRNGDRLSANLPAKVGICILCLLGILAIPAKFRGIRRELFYSLHNLLLYQMMESLSQVQKILPSDIEVVTSQGWLAGRGDAFCKALLKQALVRQFQSGETLYHYGDPADGLYSIISGAVKLTIPADDGQEFTAHRDGIGFWIGDLAMLSDQTRLISVVATQLTRTLFVPSVWIEGVVARNPAFYRDFYALEHENMRTALRILANLGVARADQRLALRLLHLEETLAQDGNWIELSQDDLAAMAVVSVPTIQRALRKLSQAGLLELGYGRLRIIDRAALLDLCQN